MTTFFKEVSSNLGTEFVQSPSVKMGLWKELDVSVEVKLSLVFWCVWRRTSVFERCHIESAAYGRAADEV